MQKTEILIADYKSQLLSSETEITDNAAMLARIEPGFWMRAITGSVIFVLELLLYVFTFILFISGIWLYLNLFSGTFSVTNDTTISGTVHNDTLDTLRYFITTILLIGSFVTLLFALFIRNSRKNLFKLAAVAEYLEKTLAARKARRNKVTDILVEVGKE